MRSCTATCVSQQPTRFVDRARPNDVYLLTRLLYGLRQAPRAWFKRFVAHVTYYYYYYYIFFFLSANCHGCLRKPSNGKPIRRPRLQPPMNKLLAHSTRPTVVVSLLSPRGRQKPDRFPSNRRLLSSPLVASSSVSRRRISSILRPPSTLYSPREEFFRDPSRCRCPHLYWTSVERRPNRESELTSSSLVRNPPASA